MVHKTTYFLAHTQKQRHKNTSPPIEPPTDAPMVILAFLKR